LSLALVLPINNKQHGQNGTGWITEILKQSTSGFSVVQGIKDDTNLQVETDRGVRKIKG
jgi:hypothetical protein